MLQYVWWQDTFVKLLPRLIIIAFSTVVFVVTGGLVRLESMRLSYHQNVLLIMVLHVPH